VADHGGGEYSYCMNKTHSMALRSFQAGSLEATSAAARRRHRSSCDHSPLKTLSDGVERQSAGVNDTGLKLNDIEDHPSTSASVSASTSICEPVGTCIQQSTCDNSRMAVASRSDSSTAAVHGAVSTITADYDRGQRGVSDFPRTAVEDAAVSEGDNCGATAAEFHTHSHHIGDDTLAGSVDTEPVDSKRPNFDGDGVLSDYNDNRRFSLQRQRETSSRSQTVDERISQDIEAALVYDTSKARGVEKRKRRVSAARSALYRRLLSSETAGASDPEDLTGDIFDLQSLSSDDDDDDDDDDGDDISDLNVDSDVDRPSLVAFMSVFLI